MNKGNILLADYKLDPFCWLIKWLTKSKWSHSAWMINDNYVIDARGTRVGIEKIDKYLNSWKYSYKILKLKGLSKAKADKITKYLKKYKRKYPHYKFLWRLMLCLFGIENKSNYRLCSEFVGLGLKFVGYKFPVKKKGFITPEDLNSIPTAIEVTHENETIYF